MKSLLKSLLSFLVLLGLSACAGTLEEVLLHPDPEGPPPIPVVNYALDVDVPAAFGQFECVKITVRISANGEAYSLESAQTFRWQSALEKAELYSDENCTEVLASTEGIYTLDVAAGSSEIDVYFRALDKDAESGAVDLTISMGELAQSVARPHVCGWVTGDLDLDRTVGSGDQGILLVNWGMDSPTFFDGDINEDNLVGSTDLSLIIGNWGLNIPCEEP